LRNGTALDDIHRDNQRISTTNINKKTRCPMPPQYAVLPTVSRLNASVRLSLLW